MTINDIYEILSSVENCNLHYLRRYLKFISSKMIQRDFYYYEEHHIIPNCMFEEKYKSDRTNLINLTAREHIIAHYILAKTFGGRHWWSINCIMKAENPWQQRKGFAILHSRLYATVKINYKIHASNFTKESRANEPKETTEARIEKWRLTYANHPEIMKLATDKGKLTLEENLKSGKTVCCKLCSNRISSKRIDKHLISCEEKQQRKLIIKEEKEKIKNEQKIQNEILREQLKIERKIKKEIEKLNRIEKIKIKESKKLKIQKLKIKRDKQDKNIICCILCNKEFEKISEFNTHVRNQCYDYNFVKDWIAAWKENDERFPDDRAKRRKLSDIERGKRFSLTLSSMTEEERILRNLKTKQGVLAYYESDKYDKEEQSRRVKLGMEKSVGNRGNRI